MRKEDQLARQVSKYLQLQYPKVIFHFDAGSGARLPMGLAMKNKRLNKHSGWPDLFIAQGKSKVLWGQGGSTTVITNGLFIEIKTEESSPFLKDGMTLKQNTHTKNQFLLHEVLRSKGYEVHFGVGFSECKAIIDKYLK